MYSISVHLGMQTHQDSLLKLKQSIRILNVYPKTVKRPFKPRLRLFEILAPLGCGGKEDLHHGCAASKPAATVGNL